MIGHLQADVALVCQRCLEPVVVGIDAGVDLVFVETEAEAERVEAGTDAMVLANGETIHVVDLLEDELLLQLPLVARHTDAEGCSLRMEPTESASEPVRQADAPEETEQNPFAVLNKLKQ